MPKKGGYAMAEHQGPICVSVINMKGGVGKTTIAALLADYAAYRANTLAIDLDPKANLSQALMGMRDYERFLKSDAPSIVEVFAGYQFSAQFAVSPRPLDIDDVDRESRRDLHLIPSTFDLSDNLTGDVSPDPKALEQLIAAEFQDKELIIIDCAPTESVFTEAAYHASHYILVPIRPEFFAVNGISLLNESLEDFKSFNRWHQIDELGVVINEMSEYESDKTPEGKTSISEIRKQAKRNGWHVFANHIEYSRGFPKVMRGGTDYLGATHTIFEKFEEEFFERLRQLTGDERDA